MKKIENFFTLYEKSSHLDSTIAPNKILEQTLMMELFCEIS